MFFLLAYMPFLCLVLLPYYYQLRYIPFFILGILIAPCSMTNDWHPLFMLDTISCLCRYFHYRDNPFSCWMQYLASARISTIEPALFHVGCSTLPLQVFPLQSQPFFMLDAVPCLYKDFHYRANPFSF